MHFSDLLAQLDPRPDVRGRQFERLCRWYLNSAPEYRGRFRHVWLWQDWPDAWGRDAGIDLVAEEKDVAGRGTTDFATVLADDLIQEQVSDLCGPPAWSRRRSHDANLRSRDR